MTNDAFERLARAYGDAVFRVAFHALGSRMDAEDVSQTALLKLYQTDKPFASDDHAKHWLLRVTVNECRKLLRAPPGASGVLPSGGLRRPPLPPLRTTATCWPR